MQRATVNTESGCWVPSSKESICVSLLQSQWDTVEEGCKRCKKEPEGVEKCGVSLSLGSMATALMNSQQLWLPTQGLEVGPAHMPSWMVEELKKL